MMKIKASPFEDLKVLYVEDDPGIREAVAAYLGRRIKNLHCATNGKEGLDYFLSHSPDVVITDIRMPLMNGIELAKAIKKVDKNIPIIITTSHNDEEYLIQSIDIGVDKYLKKPLHIEDLLHAVEKVSETFHHRMVVNAHNDLLKAIMDSNPVFILLITGEELFYINKSLLKFLGFDTLRQLKESGRNIDDFFLATKDSLYKGKKFTQAIEEIFDSNEERYMVRIEGHQGDGERVFLVQPSRVPEILHHNSYLVTFSDVTCMDNERRLYRMLSLTDSLTGIYNRNKLFGELDRETRRSIRSDSSLSMIILDIDHFKTVNDTYGHQAGDSVLCELTTLVGRHIRRTDIFARYGGEEFVILAPDTGKEGAVLLAEKIRSAVETHRFNHVEHLTCSFGVAGFEAQDFGPGNEHRLGPDTCLAPGLPFLEKADKALYLAKKNGRNRVEVL